VERLEKESRDPSSSIKLPWLIIDQDQGEPSTTRKIQTTTIEKEASPEFDEMNENMPAKSSGLE
jgi:hypothetical protein